MKGTWPAENLVLAATSLMFCYKSTNNNNNNNNKGSMGMGEVVPL